MISYGSGEGSKQLNILLSLTRAVLCNKDEKRIGAYIKVWMFEALDLPEGLNHIAAGLFLLVKGTGFDFKNQTILLKKCEEKLKSVPTETADKLAEYYKTLES